MGEYRNKTTGEVKTQADWAMEFPNTSLPKVWNDSVLEALGLDPVLPSPPATTTAYQTSVRDGVEQDANGNWVEKYVARDLFADDDELGTKSDQEAAYQRSLDDAKAEVMRIERNRLLAETDFYALTDVTLSAEMTTYRQNLRDLPTNDNWPNLTDSDWPTKP